MITLNVVTPPFNDNCNRANGELGPNWLDQLGDTEVQNNAAVARVNDPTSADPDG